MVDAFHASIHSSHVSCNVQEGIWVVGMILGSPAQTAGVEQGDQLLQIDNVQVNGQSPFQAASAISGGDAEPDVIPEPIVHLQVMLQQIYYLATPSSPVLCCAVTCADGDKDTDSDVTAEPMGQVMHIIIILLATVPSIVRMGHSF